MRYDVRFSVPRDLYKVQAESGPTFYLESPDATGNAHIVRLLNLVHEIIKPDLLDTIYLTYSNSSYSLRYHGAERGWLRM